MLARAWRKIPPVVRGIQTLGEGPSEFENDYLDSKIFYDQLTSKGFDFFTGIPDTTYKTLLQCLDKYHPPQKHIIAANEGTAIGLAAGYHLATGRFPVVYMQNAGIGNAVNPILSLVDSDVYKIPMLILMGWRGEPGTKDEPQYMAQGSVMPSLLTDLRLTYEILPDYQDGADIAIDLALNHLQVRNQPYAFLVRRGIFAQNSLVTDEPKFPYTLSRDESVEFIIQNIGKFDALLSTSGLASRQVLYIRDKLGMEPNDFYCLGARGHISSIALGVAVSKPSKTVYCIDGDGSVILHMGGLAQIGGRAIKNIKHIVLNNGVHETVGGAPTVGHVINIPQLAKACGYNYTVRVETMEELKEKFSEFQQAEGPALLEVKVGKQTENPPPLRFKPENIKHNFMRFLDF